MSDKRELEKLKIKNVMLQNSINQAFANTMQVCKGKECKKFCSLTCLHGLVYQEYLKILKFEINEIGE